MTEKIKKLFSGYREIILFVIFGALTTVVNYAVYVAWTAAFTGKHANVEATAAAWVVAVLFAYFTNRKWVFESKAEGFAAKFRECSAFFASRIFSGLVDVGIMYAAVDVMGYDGRIVKLLSNVLVIVLNYIFSKFLVFNLNPAAGKGAGKR